MTLAERLAAIAALTGDERTAAIAELLVDVEDLDAFRAEIEAFYAETRAAEDAGAQLALLTAARDARAAVRAEQESRDALAAQVDEALAGLDADMTDPEPEQEPEAETPEEPAEPEPAPEEVAEVTPEPVAAAAAPRPRAPVSAAARHVPAEVAPRPRAGKGANKIVGVAGGLAAHELAGGIPEVAKLVAAQFRATHGTVGNGEKLAVARIQGDYETDRILDGGYEDNMAKVQAVGAGPVEALVAAGGICAPSQPYYGMAVIEDDARPVRAGLANFAAPRLRVNLILPDQIGDFDTATDEWTNADDAAVNAADSATWKPVQTITCGSETTYTLRAVTKILQFGNFDARSHPEKVEAVLAKAMANHARLAESLLLDDIKASSTVVNANGIVGATPDTLVRVSQAAAGYRNRNRMPMDAVLDWYAPAWLRDAMQSDLALRAPGDMSLDDTLAEIEGYLRIRNIRPIWYLDSPTAGHSQYFGAQSGGTVASTLNAFPTYAQWGLHHQGAFLFLDGGELDLGTVRDSDLNRQNSFQVFSETFERAAYVGVEALWVTQLVDVSGGYSGSEDIGS